MHLYTFIVAFIALALYKNVSSMLTFSVKETKEMSPYLNELSRRYIANAQVSHNAIIDHNGDLNGAASALMSADGNGQIHVDDDHHGETYHYKEQEMKSEYHSDTETGDETRDFCSTHSEGTIYPDN